MSRSRTFANPLLTANAIKAFHELCERHDTFQEAWNSCGYKMRESITSYSRRNGGLVTMSMYHAIMNAAHRCRNGIDDTPPELPLEDRDRTHHDGDFAMEGTVEDDLVSIPRAALYDMVAEGVRTGEFPVRRLLERIAA